MSHRRGDSNTVLIVILGIAAVGIMVCCGVGYFAFVKVGEVATEVKNTLEKAQEDMNVTDPKKIDAVRAEIATIEIPPVFKPEKASTIPFVNLHRVIYRAQTDKQSSFGFLTLADATDEHQLNNEEMSGNLTLDYAGHDSAPGRSKPSKVRAKNRSMKKAEDAADEEGDEDEPKPKQAADKNSEPGKPKDTEQPSDAKKPDEQVETKFETREPTINGKKAHFQIVQVMDSDKKLVKIELYGEFRNKSLKFAQIKMQVTPDLVNYEQTIKLIDSIR